MDINTLVPKVTDRQTAAVSRTWMNKTPSSWRLVWLAPVSNRRFLIKSSRAKEQNHNPLSIKLLRRLGFGFPLRIRPPVSEVENVFTA
jgi:hypothetical protein